MLYDDNLIQLDGPTGLAFSEDVLERFRAYGWQTLRVKDGTDVGAIEAAIRLARSDDRPSIIAVRTVIGFGSPNKAGSQKAHGAPLGPDEVRLTKEAYGWDPEKSFFVPDAVAAIFSRAILYGEDLAGRWTAAFERYRTAFPAEASAFERRFDGDLAAGWDAALPRWETGAEVATRNASADTINALAAGVPELFGGSADLSESNLTDVKGGGDFSAASAGPQPALRRPRARHGWDRQRPRLPRRLPAVRGHVPHLLRLHARQRPRGGPVRAPRDLRLDPRLGGPRRGRAHPPAGRALRGPAGDPEPLVRPAGRRERDGGRLGARARADATGRPRSPSRARSSPSCRARPRRPRGRPARRVRDPRRVDRGRPAARPTSSSSPRAPRSSWPSRPPRPSRPRGSRPASSASPAGKPSRPRTRPTARASSRRRRRSASPSRWASRSAGSAGPATRGRSSPSTTSARRRPRARS